MDRTKGRLVVLQGVGGLALLPYPVMLLFGVVSYGSGFGSDPGKTAILVATALYPGVWVGLWMLSWKAFAQGRVLKAFLLSTPPALPIVAYLAVMVAVAMSH